MVHVLPPEPVVVVTTPVPSPIEIEPPQLQLQVPPGVACDNVVPAPSQMDSVPVGDAGVAPTVTTAVA
jgi:hypothetical protein